MTTATPAQRDDGDERVAVSASGVQVRKWVATDEAAVPVVRYELASARDDDVTVRVTDAVPSHLEPDEVGFHDAHHGDRWDRPGDRAIRFETPLPAGEEVTTLYGVRRPEIEDPSAFLDEPEVAVDAETTMPRAAPTEPAPSAADEDVNERLRRALAEASAASDGDGEAGTAENGESLEGAGTGSREDGDGAAAAAGTFSLDQQADSDSSRVRADGDSDRDSVGGDDGGDGPVWAGSSPAAAVDAGDDELASAREETTESSSGDSSGAVSDSNSPEPAADDRDAGGARAREASTDEAVANALVAELQEGTVDAETRETLARELNLQLSASSSQFVEHLQSRMKEKRGQLEGDIERLEDSIAELYGLKADSAEVSSVREEKADVDAVAAVEERLEALRVETAELEALEALRDDVEALESTAATTDELAATRSDLADRLGALDARVCEVDERVSGVDERAASEAGVEEFARGVRELDDDTPSLAAFESLEDAHESLASDVARERDVSTLQESLSTLEETLDERREAAVADLEDRIDGERRTREDGFASLSNRVDDLRDRAAAAERVASIEADLDRAYVTESDVTGTIEARLQRSLLARTLLVAVGASSGAGVALAATGVTAGVLLVVLALTGLAYWWHLQNGELDAA